MRYDPTVPTRLYPKHKQPTRVVMPELHEVQKIFGSWSEDFPDAQCLIAPCGTKTGKSFGSAWWLLVEALTNPRFFCVWIGPTKDKCKIGYRYMKAMLPDIPEVDAVDGIVEIRLGNGSVIKFLHGRDAETTVEGEAIDRFVIDEAGKQTKQLWYSLFTTITQTGGKGIVTGTPRGFTWYYDEFRRAKQGDPFYVWAQLCTEQSPYVTEKAIKQAKRLLPAHLYDQYYRAMFVSMSTTFGDISGMFDESIKVKPNARFWIHPDPAERALDTVTGWDIAKQRDYSVFYTVNTNGKLVGYCRFRRVGYDTQVDRLKHYLHTYFSGDRSLRYDATGVGSAVGDILSSKDVDASITAVTFTNRSKQEMVNRVTVAIENDWHKAPRIEQIEHEFGSYEVKVTKSGNYTYSAPDGKHDDVVSAAMLAISGAYISAEAEKAEAAMAEIMNGSQTGDEDIYEMVATEFADEDDVSFFDTDEETNEDFEFNDDED